MRDVFHALDRLARTRPDDTAFREGAEAIGWAGLAHRVAALAAALDAAPATVGLAVFGGIDHVIADLAVSLAGRRLVPLPPFFSPEQKAHVLRDAAVGLLTSPYGGADAVPATPDATPSTRLDEGGEDKPKHEDRRSEDISGTAPVGNVSPAESGR